MPNFHELEKTLTSALNLTRRPVAVSFQDAPPAAVEKFEGTQPSGCSFWQMAAQGRVFYTVPADHYNCPVGSYTHNFPLSPEREPELMQTLRLMAGIGYISMAEMPAIPRLAATPTTVVYAPLGDTPVNPDVVIVAGRPGQLMLLLEAAIRGGAPLQPLLGRPTCVAIPVAMQNATVSSLGCVGNRIYTGLADDELYTVMPGKQLAAIVEQLGTIVSANAALTAHHTQRLATLRT